MTRIAIVGAGLSGLVTARALSEDHSVSVFEKARGAGGRMSTRYAGDWFFDHGAQFFTARGPAFQRYLEPLIETGVVRPWHARFVEIDGAGVSSTRNWDEEYPHYVACPNMNALGKHLASWLDVTLNVAVDRFEKRRDRWQVYDTDSNLLGEFDWVIVTAPAPQAANLLPGDSPLARHARSVPILPCFALMLGFDAAPETGWDAALVKDSPISWISVNSSKPDRVGKPGWVAHASNAWAARHLDDDPATVERTLRRAVSAASGHDVATAAHCSLHRWRYANVDRQAAAPQIDVANRLASCGDWFVRGRVEGAFDSARRVVEQLRQAI